MVKVMQVIFYTLLKEAVDSILAQTYTDFELIIVNDASPDDLEHIVKGYDDSRIRYYVNRINLGSKDLVAQWNHCLEYALGDYIILASDDDVYHPQYLEKMDVLVEKYPEVNVFRPRVQYIDEEGNILYLTGLLKEYTSKLEFAFMRGIVGSGIPFYLFKRKKLISIGGFVNYPLGWCSDDATALYMADKGIGFSSEVLFSFRHSTINISCKKNSYRVLKKKILAAESFHHELLYIINNDSVDPLSKFFRDYIICDTEKRRFNHVGDLFLNSSIISTIRCLPLLWRIDVFSLRKILILYCKTIVKRFL